MFLGLLLDTQTKTISIPVDKLRKALCLIEEFLGAKKTTIKQLQCLCGFLNFLCRCVIPGRTLTRRLYTKLGHNPKPYHHINLNKELKADLEIWRMFLSHPSAYARPFIDFSVILSAVDLDLYMDASGVIGCGGIFGSRWFQCRWDLSFLNSNLVSSTKSCMQWLWQSCSGVPPSLIPEFVFSVTIKPFAG